MYRISALSAILILGILLTGIIPVNSRKPAAPQNTNNLDSLLASVESTGWNSRLLDSYTFYILNNKITGEEKKKTESLPGSVEKQYLVSLLLKKEQSFQKMYEILSAELDKKPAWLSYYDELIFAANAVGNITLLQDAPAAQKLPKDYSLYMKGLIHESRGEYKDALIKFKGAYANLQDYHVSYKISYAYRNVGEYDSSFIFLKKAIDASGGNKAFLNKTLIAEGTLNYLSGDYSKSRQLYQKALNLSRENKDRQGELTALVNLGILYDLNGNTESARNNFAAALDISKNISDPESEAFVLSETGVSFTFTNEIVDAKNYYLESYTLYKKINDRLRLSFLSSNIAKLFIYLFDYQEALLFYERSVDYAGDNKYAQAQALTGMGDVYANLSNYSKALRLYREAEKISSEIKELTLQSQVNSGLGALNYNLDRYRNALIYYNRAENYSDKAGDVYSIADINYKKGVTYISCDSLDKALKCLTASSAAASEAGDFFTEANAYVNIASLRLKENNLSSAEKYLALAEKISTQNKLDYQLGLCSLIKGEIAQLKNNFSASSDYFQNALAYSQKILEPNIQVEAYYRLAELNISSNNLQEAEKYFKEAINIIDNVSFPLFPEQDVQISYFSGKSNIYSSLVRFYINQEKYKEAFSTLERSRSRNTLQSVSSLKLKSAVKDSTLLSKLFDYEWEINSGVYNKNKKDSLRQALSDVKQKIINKYPGAVHLLERSMNAGLPEIQSALKRGENIISVYSDSEGTSVFLIKKDSFTQYNSKYTSAEIAEMVSAVSPSYGNGSNGFVNQDLFSFNASAASVLYNNVFRKVFSTIKYNEEVIISPSAELLTFPFEMLVASYNNDDSPYLYKGKDYLVKHYNISYTPSASLFIKEKGIGNDITNKYVLMGNPAINYGGKEFSERRGLLDENQDLTGAQRSFAFMPLQYSAEEINEIDNILRADKVFSENNATETNFKNNAANSSIIHLSTHSFLFNKQPVIFFSSMYDADNDGFLEAGEIASMNLNSDLVVLSSCSSGLGEIDNSEGILGMTKAFFEAGARSMVVSLWEVNDRYTSKFMSLFYQYLTRGYNKSEALRHAKLSFMKKYSANPYYWGAFVLSGDLNKINFVKPASSIPYITAIILLLLLSAAVVLVKKLKIR